MRTVGKALRVGSAALGLAALGTAAAADTFTLRNLKE